MSYEQLLERLRGDIAPPIFPSGLMFWVIVVILVVAVIGFLLWFFPVYNVWASRKSGLADLAQAENEQRVQIAEARGRREAAELNKEAAIIEASAVAAQIEKIGTNLQKHDLYLKWQWIKMMEDHSNDATIYIPTEAGLPILEAGKRGDTQRAEE